jgi:RNA polymerase sigma-70 factor (ECF subfamily)
VTVTSSSAQPGTVGGEVGDRVLVAACRDGDQEAFVELVHRYHDSLCRQARRRLANVVDVDDAVQETFLRAYRSLHRVELADDTPLGPWLARILANVCTDQAARERRQAELAERAGPLDPQVTAPVEVDPPTALALQRGLRALPAPQRQAFLLRAVADLSYREIAERLGTTEENARARVVRARAALRQDLARQGLPAAVPLGALALLRQGGHRLARGFLRVLGSLRPGGRGARLAEAHAAQAQQALGAAGPAATSLLAQGSSGAATSLLAQGAQLCTQVCLQAATSPVVQGAVALASAGTGRGTLVAGLAATLATAGALALPATTAHAAPPSGPSVVSALRAAPSSTAIPGSSATSGSTSGNEAGSSTVSDVIGLGTPAGGVATNDQTTAGGSGSSAGIASSADAAPPTGPVVAPSSPAAPVVPSWAEQAAAIATSPRATTTGPLGTTTSTKTSSSSATSSTSSATGNSSGSVPRSTSSTGLPYAATSGTPKQGDNLGSSPAGRIPVAGGSSTYVFPSQCTTLPGDLGTTPAAPPPLGVSELAGLAAGGPFDVTGSLSQPQVNDVVDISSVGIRWGSEAVQFSISACLGTQSGLLVGRATASNGGQVLLTAGLVDSEPNLAPSGATPSSNPATAASPAATDQASTWDFLFRGSVDAVAGASDPAFDQVTQFVALVQVTQPTDTLSFDIVFVQPSQPASVTSSTSTGQAPASPAPPGATSPAATSEPGTSDSTAGAAGDSSSTAEGTSSTTTDATTSTTAGDSSSSSAEDGATTPSSGPAGTPAPSTSTGG